MSKSNVIDISTRIKTSPQTSRIADLSDGSENGQIINFQEHRAERNNDNRRKVTRTVLSQFIGVFIVLRDGILQPINLHDISAEGVAFDLGKDRGSFNVDEVITLRIYMSHDTYFSFGVTVTNLRNLEEDGVIRHGAMFKKTTDNSSEALYHFVRFLESVASVAKKDRGEKLSGRVD